MKQIINIKNKMNILKFVLHWLVDNRHNVCILITRTTLSFSAITSSIIITQLIPFNYEIILILSFSFCCYIFRLHAMHSTSIFRYSILFFAGSFLSTLLIAVFNISKIYFDKKNPKYTIHFKFYNKTPWILNH